MANRSQAFFAGGQRFDLRVDNEKALKILGVYAKAGSCYLDNLSGYRAHFNNRCKWGVIVRTPLNAFSRDRTLK